MPISIKVDCFLPSILACSAQAQLNSDFTLLLFSLHYLFYLWPWHNIYTLSHQLAYLVNNICFGIVLFRTELREALDVHSSSRVRAGGPGWLGDPEYLQPTSVPRWMFEISPWSLSVRTLRLCYVCTLVCLKLACLQNSNSGPVLHIHPIIFLWWVYVMRLVLRRRLR